MKITTDILVIGGGIAGMMSAIRLLRSGHNVHIVSPISAKGNATWAAAGMLAAEAEARENPGMPADMKLFLQQSRSLWEDWAAHYVPESCRQNFPGLNRTGTYLFDHDISLHGDAYINPRDVYGALIETFGHLGGIWHEDSIQRLNSRSCLIGLAHTYSTDHVIVAAGLGASKLGITELEGLLPVKGQMISVRASEPITPAMYRCGDIYIVVHSQDHIIIGATEEPGIADLSLDSTLADKYLQQARAVFPDVTLNLHQSWAGLRPTTLDRLPVIGPLGRPNMWAIGGLYRHGILASPAAADLMYKYISGTDLPGYAASFLPSRFS